MNFTHKDRTNHGIDIAKGRVDDLDKEVIRFALEYKGRKVAVDIGSGQSRLSHILALLGFEVWMYDIENHEKYCATLEKSSGLGGRLHFKQIDIAGISYTDLPDDIVIAVSQRTLHHVPHQAAKNILEKVSSKMITGGKLFVSVSSTESKFVGNYDCADFPVENRFCRVVGSDDFYAIDTPVCLYEQKEVTDMLEGAGLIIDKIYKSAFGNIKAIASKD